MHVEHEATLGPPAAAVYEALADVSRWPAMFGPTVHAERLSLTGGDETIRLWALANGQVKSWVSARVLDPARRTVRFRQTRPAAPVAAMGGEWILTPAGDRTRVVLTHDFRAADDDPEVLEWIARAVDTNSRAELAALATALEAPAGAHLDFTDEVRIPAPIEQVYDFLYRAGDWPHRIPHVAGLDLVEEVAGVQRMDMVTRTPDGVSHRTSSIRICAAPDRIFYKQTVTPALMRSHAGSWLLREEDGHVVVAARHEVRINPDAGVALPDARRLIRQALGGNSTATLRHAAAFVAGGDRV
jgi:aromatase